MKPVTIDNLDIKEHIRWAQDRKILDATIVQESQHIAPYPDISGMSAIFSSQLEELFDLEIGMHPWANFAPPQNAFLFAKRFFSHRLFPNIHWKEQDEEESEEEEEREEEEEGQKNSSEDLIQVILSVQQFTDQSFSLFEKDKNTILSLLESIRSIDDMLAQIYGRRLQYQKG